MKTPFIFAEFRKSLGLTQEEFAEKCGATVRSVQNWEQGGTITPQAMKLFQYIEAEILSGKEVDSRDHSVSVSGSNNSTSLTEQTTYGANSPAVSGDNNHFGGCGSLDRSFDEIAEQRKLLERALSLLEKKDAQIDRLISLLELQNQR